MVRPVGADPGADLELLHTGRVLPEKIHYDEESLGEGSLGKVFKACHVATGRVIAIKVIPKLGAATAARLATEIQAIERKGHGL